MPHAETGGEMTERVNAKDMRERIFADVRTPNVRSAIPKLHYMCKRIKELREVDSKWTEKLPLTYSYPHEFVCQRCDFCTCYIRKTQLVLVFLVPHKHDLLFESPCSNQVFV